LHTLEGLHALDQDVWPAAQRGNAPSWQGRRPRAGRREIGRAGVAIIGAMKTRSLEILGRSQLPPAQAHATLEVMEMEIAAGHESLASRVDLLDVKSALKVEITDLRAELKAEIHKVEGALSRWVLTCVLSCILGQTAVLAGLGYFVLEHLRR